VADIEDLLLKLIFTVPLIGTKHQRHDTYIDCRFPVERHSNCFPGCEHGSLPFLHA